MKCLLFLPFSIIVLLLNGGHNGANNNCVFVTQKIHDIKRLSNYLLHSLLDKLNVKKTTSVIVIMCLQIWMQLRIGSGPIVEELKVISKEEEKKISTCKMLFPSISFLRALLPECVSHWLFDSIFKQPQIIYL